MTLSSFMGGRTLTVLASLVGGAAAQCDSRDVLLAPTTPSSTWTLEHFSAPAPEADLVSQGVLPVGGPGTVVDVEPGERLRRGMYRVLVHEPTAMGVKSLIYSFDSPFLDAPGSVAPAPPVEFGTDQLVLDIENDPAFTTNEPYWVLYLQDPATTSPDLYLARWNSTGLVQEFHLNTKVETAGAVAVDPQSGLAYVVVYNTVSKANHLYVANPLTLTVSVSQMMGLTPTSDIVPNGVAITHKGTGKIVVTGHDPVNPSLSRVQRYGLAGTQQPLLLESLSLQFHSPSVDYDGDYYVLMDNHGVNTTAILYVDAFDDTSIWLDDFSQRSFDAGTWMGRTAWSTHATAGTQQLSAVMATPPLIGSALVYTVNVAQGTTLLWMFSDQFTVPGSTALGPNAELLVDLGSPNSGAVGVVAGVGGTVGVPGFLGCSLNGGVMQTQFLVDLGGSFATSNLVSITVGHEPNE
ncbi:MAG: hypothetical protein AAF628_14015 [Planctomycetota bacterium]